MKFPPLIVIIIALSSTSLWGQAIEESPDTWHVYSSSKYGYEIRVPKGFEVRSTGPDGRRDGATIRVAREKFTAPVPVLDITIHPKTTEADFLRLPTRLKDIKATVTDINLSGRPAKEAIYKWKSSGELAFSVVYLNGVVFHFAAAAGTKDMRETEWWKIISSFRLIGK